MEENYIHNIRELIKANKFDAFFILDSDKEKILINNEVLYEVYCTKSKRLINNSLFLYRQPKRLAKNRKFNIYGGGIIYKIDFEHGEYIAHIKDGFELIDPIEEDNEYLKNMKWTSKIKTNDGWDHFWSQYGINEINKEDMLNLMKKSSFIFCKDKSAIITKNQYDDTILDDTKIVADEFLKNASITSSNDATQNSRFYIRDLVNRLVANLETEKLEFLGLSNECKVEILPRIKRVEKGYDILSYDEDGSEINIEVKISPTGQRKLTHVSRRELELFSNLNFRLYTIYNLDPNTGTFDLVISKGAELLNDYDFEPMIYSARLKNRRNINE